MGFVTHRCQAPVKCHERGIGDLADCAQVAIAERCRRPQSRHAAAKFHAVFPMFLSMACRSIRLRLV